VREDSKESCFLRAAAIFLYSLDWKASFFRGFRDFRDLEASRLSAGAGMSEGVCQLQTGSDKHRVFIATGGANIAAHIALGGIQRSIPGSAEYTNRETQRPSDFGYWAFVFCGVVS